MRSILVSLALATATALGAQGVPAPTAPAGAKPSGTKAELRVSGFMINGDHSYDFSNNVSTETGSIQGVDVLLRAAAIGLSFRSMTGTYGDQPHLTSADARLYLFPPAFSIMVGAQRRALWSDLNATSPSQFDMGLAGLSSTLSIGGTGLRTNISAAVYLPAGEIKEKVKNGMEGEASLLYRIPMVPLFVQLGYRTEVFTGQAVRKDQNGNSVILGSTPEEVRGVRLGAGLQLGGH
ncbi:MAG TPA: hypothetical protein VJ867_06535 [Gemmatimonadaceae bacterium]|nr:hypothetical protein [Gemmatimonadaceae bacterium]